MAPAAMKINLLYVQEFLYPFTLLFSSQIGGIYLILCHKMWYSSSNNIFWGTLLFVLGLEVILWGYFLVIRCPLSALSFKARIEKFARLYNSCDRLRTLLLEF